MNPSRRVPFPAVPFPPGGVPLPSLRREGTEGSVEALLNMEEIMADRIAVQNKTPELSESRALRQSVLPRKLLLHTLRSGPC